MIEDTESATPDADAKLADIGGWLVLPAIGLVLDPVLWVVSLAVGGALFSTVAATGHGGLFAVEMFVEFGLLIFMIYAASRFFRKKRDAPTVRIVLEYRDN